MKIMSLIKHQTFEVNFRVSKTLNTALHFKNHNNVGTEYRHATKNDFYSNLYFQIFTPTSASQAISTVCEGMLHTL